MPFSGIQHIYVQISANGRILLVIYPVYCIYEQNMIYLSEHRFVMLISR